MLSKTLFSVLLGFLLGQNNVIYTPYPTIQGICCSFEIASVWDLRVGDRVSALFKQYSPIFTKKDISF